MPSFSPLAPVDKRNRSYLQDADNLRLVVCCPKCERSYLLTLEEFRGLLVEYFSRMKIDQKKKAHLIREVLEVEAGYMRYVHSGHRRRQKPAKQITRKSSEKVQKIEKKSEVNKREWHYLHTGD